MSFGLLLFDRLHFANPEWLWLLLAVAVLPLLKGGKGKSASVRFSSTALVKGLALQSRSMPGALVASLRMLSLAALVVALARPQSASSSASEIEASGIDIVLAIDLSGSMRAHDFEKDDEPTDRLTVVKDIVKEFIERRPNDRIGLTVFASNPYLVSPLTLNHEWLLRNLERVEIGLIAGESTAIGSALGLSVKRLTAHQAKSRVIILLTDGANNAGSVSPVAAAEAAASYGVKTYTIGAGREGRVPYPLVDSSGNYIIGYNGQKQFRYVNSDVDAETLERIAEITGGRFYRATDTDELRSIYEEIDKLEKTEVKMKFKTAYTDLFHWLVLGGFCLLVIEQALSHTVFRKLP